MPLQPQSRHKGFADLRNWERFFKTSGDAAARPFCLYPRRIPGHGHWPHQLYVREARRMVSDYVMTEHNCRGRQKAEDPIALAAYTMDSHNCQRLVKGDHAENEGDVQAGGFPPYPISYRSIVPKAARVREPAGARLPLRHPHCLRLDPDGAGVHDPGPIRRHGRRPGAGPQVSRAEAPLRNPPRPSAGRQAGAEVGEGKMNPLPSAIGYLPLAIGY